MSEHTPDARASGAAAPVVSPNRTVALLAMACIVAWIVMAWLVSPGIAFAKLQWDAAVYLAQARHLWTSGSASGIVLGDGMVPIIYSPLAAYLRAPLFGLTDDPAVLMRLVQAENVLVLTVLGWIASRYMAERLPPEASRRWLMAPWLALTLTYNPWALNLVLPLGDHLYGVMIIGVFLLAVEPRRAQADAATARLRGAAIAAMCVLAVIQKFTSLALLPALLLSHTRGSRRARLLFVPLVPGIAAVAWLGRKLFSFYIQGAFQRYLDGKSIVTIVLDSLTNLVVAALPNEIVPNFSYLFQRDFSATHAVLFGDLNVSNAPFALLGAAISATIGIGAWRMRQSMRAELLFVLMVMPVYAIVSNSTARYLSSVQPVLMIWLVAALPRRRVTRCPTRLLAAPAWLLRSRWGLAAATVLAASVILPNLAGSISARRSISLAETLQFLDALNAGFERGRGRLEALRQTYPTISLLHQVDDIRWYAIAGLGYVSPASATARVCAGRPVYAVFVCDIRNCSRLSAQLRKERAGATLDLIDFQSVYRDDDTWGRFDIDRLVPRAGTLCSAVTQPTASAR